MKQFAINLILVCFFLTSCSSTNVDKDDEAYKNSKESLQEKERNNPLKFLSIDGANKKNLLGQTVVRCVVRNNATVMSYKDVRIKMLCYDNDAMIREHENVVEKALEPNSTMSIKIRYRLPKGTDSIALSVMSATPVEP